MPDHAERAREIVPKGFLADCRALLSYSLEDAAEEKLRQDIAAALDAVERGERERCFAWAIGRVPRSDACRAIKDGRPTGTAMRDPNVCWQCGEPLHQGHYCATAVERDTAAAKDAQIEQLKEVCASHERALSLYADPGSREVVLAEARAAAARGGWRPIESAPSDGEKILVVGGHHTEPTIAPADGEYWRSSYAPKSAVPTHWMPLTLPPLPEPAPREGGEG